MNPQIEQINGLSVDEKRRLLADLLRQQALEPKKSLLSFAQERLWFLTALHPEDPAYNVPVAFRLSGDLNVAALEQSINAIVARHETLRTTFAAVDGEPFQFISASETLKLEFIDLTSWPDAEVDIECKRLTSAMAEQPFDLTRDRPLRASLIRLAADDHLLLLTMHHIVSDAWSVGILIQELSSFYKAFSIGSVASLPELPIQYRDFAEWQRNRLQGESLKQQVAYWASQLTGAAKLNLPADHVRPTVRTSRGAHLAFNLGRDISKRLKDLSTAEGVTPFMILLAAFKVLLFRYTGERDIVVGSPIAGRNRVETENLIGFFVNSLALRTDLSGNPTFRQLVARVREITLEAYTHQDLPFEKLVEELNPVRDVSRTPVFQVMFGLQNAPRAAIDLPNLTVKRVSVDSQTAKFDLTLLMSETGHGLTGWLEYSTDLFERSTIERLRGHFENLLVSITLNPDGRIAALPLMSAREQQQIQSDWNATKTAFPRERCIHDLFEAQALQRPGDVAVIFNDREVTYGELNKRANQLGHYLRRQGVGPEVVVGLALDRSIEMIVGILAVLKAGGAYLPLDRSYPHERLLFMIKQANARIILTQSDVLANWPASEAKLIALDGNQAHLSSDDDRNLESVSGPENLAYVIYTSGSTGQPKGVSVTHRNVVRLVKETKYARFEAGEVFLQFAPVTFDAATFEIWGALLNGARLVVTAPGIESLQSLGQTIQRYGVTTLWLTAGLFHQIADTELNNLSGVKQLIAGGDVLSPAHVEKVAQTLVNCQLINGYGPTENTTFTCCGTLKAGSVDRSVPIGRPISNTQVYVLSDELEPVPVGVPGELFVGGDGLARGYLQDPSATAERFVPNPFAGEPGERLYRTGDEVRYRADGSLEFLGRLDHQLKIRGYRIEAGEIETQLLGHPNVAQAVVVAQQDEPDEKRLIAYLTLTNGQGVNSSELRSYLKERLPEYMVPAGFVTLDKLPFTRSGKVNRRALPTYEAARDLAEEFIAPRTPVEEGIAEIWKKVLRVESVSVRDNFFELGGHSLLAVRLLSEIEKLYGQKIPLTFLFQGATIEQLAAVLTVRKSQDNLTLFEIKSGQWRPPFFCVSVPDVNALGYVPLARHLPEEQPVYVLQAAFHKDWDEEYSVQEVESLATEYIRAMRELQPEGPYMLGGMCAGALIAFEMARQLEAEGQQISMVAIFDTWAIHAYNSLWWVDYYSRKFMFLLRKNWRYKVNFVATKTKGVLKNIAGLFQRGSRDGRVSSNVWRTGYYTFPDFVSQVYHGRVIVFRTRKQPYYRIRDEALGWRRRALGGVDVEIVPGDHTTILREPNVKILAAKMGESIRLMKEFTS
jgi:amino acid adenylation domain-containing protein